MTANEKESLRINLEAQEKDIAERKTREGAATDPVLRRKEKEVLKMREKLGIGTPKTPAPVIATK